MEILEKMAALISDVLNSNFKNTIMKQLIISILIFSCFACGDNTCTTVNLGEETEVKNGDLLCIEGEEFTLIAEDQRCACGATCVWQGEFLLSFQSPEGVNEYTYHQVDTMSNVTPPFASSFSLVNLLGEGECGDEEEIDNVTFVIQID